MPSAPLPGKSAHGQSLVGNGSHSQRADVGPFRQRRLFEHFRPGIDRVAAEGRRDMAAAVDGRNAKPVGEAVERQRPRQRNHMPAIGQAPAEARVLAGMGVEMDARGVLVEPRREHVVGVLERDAAHMVDALAGLVVVPAMRRAGRLVVVAHHREVGHDQIGRRHRRRGLRHDRRADLRPQGRACAPSPSECSRAPSRRAGWCRPSAPTPRRSPCWNSRAGRARSTSPTACRRETPARPSGTRHSRDWRRH